MTRDSRTDSDLLVGRRDDRSFGRAVRAGLVVSFLLHVALFFGWTEPADAPRSGEPAPADRSGTPVAGALQAVDVGASPSGPAAEIPPPPEPVREPPERRTVPEPAVAADFASMELARRAFERPARGGADAPGRDVPGTSRGEAVSGEATPPMPRSLLPEWDPPESVRGSEVTVRVHVDAGGEPTGAVELCPPTPHEGFNEKLIAKVRKMTFAPARSAGEPVEGWAELTFVF